MILLLLFLPVFAWAQDSLTGLKPGDTVYVTDRTEQRIKGKLAGVTGSSVTLTVHGSRREFALQDLREIRVRQSDRLRNGALIGLGAGIGAGLLGIRQTCDLPDRECAVIAGTVLVPIGAGLGALTGAVVDALIHKSSLVYQNPAQGPRAAVSFSPLVGAGRRGLALAIRF